jgi:hypothetical protein
MARKSKPNPEKGPTEPIGAVEAMLRIRHLVAEFFDHAIILVSREEQGETRFLHTEIGNKFAVRGMMDVFVDQYMEDSIEDASPKEDEDDDKGEDWKKEIA